MGELQVEKPGARPGPRRHTENATPATMPLRRGITTTYDLIICITEHGWIGQAAARWRISFVWFARLLSHICFAAFVDAYFLSISAIDGLQAV